MSTTTTTTTTVVAKIVTTTTTITAPVPAPMVISGLMTLVAQTLMRHESSLVAVQGPNYLRIAFRQRLASMPPDLCWIYPGAASAHPSEDSVRVEFKMLPSKGFQLARKERTVDLILDSESKSLDVISVAPIRKRKNYRITHGDNSLLQLIELAFYREKLVLVEGS